MIRDCNLELLLNVFDNDIFKVLDVCREHKSLTVTFTLKTVERSLVKKLLKASWSETMIAEAMGLNMTRVKKIKKGLEDGK